MCEASRWRKYKRKKMKKKVQIEKVISSQTCFLQFCKLDYWNTKLTGECKSTTTDLEGGVIVLKIALKIIESCWTTITRTRRWTFVAGIISVENSIRKTKWQPIKKEQKTKNNNRNVPIPVWGRLHNNWVTHLEIINHTQQFLKQLYLFFRIDAAWDEHKHEFEQHKKNQTSVKKILMKLGIQIRRYAN